MPTCQSFVTSSRRSIGKPSSKPPRHWATPSYLKRPIILFLIPRISWTIFIMLFLRFILKRVPLFALRRIGSSQLIRVFLICFFMRMRSDYNVFCYFSLEFDPPSSQKKKRGFVSRCWKLRFVGVMGLYCAKLEVVLWKQHY